MSTSSPDLIVCRGLTKTYQSDSGPIPALEPVTVSLPESGTMAIVGPSGCGKTTLLLLMAGLEKPSSGAIFFKDMPLERPHREIALVLQDYGLFPWKTVRENVILGLRIRKEATNGNRIQQLMDELNIGDKPDLYPQQLSGGQKQRVALARALILNPSLMLMDEPFAALDTLNREKLQDLVLALWNKRKFSMVLVTHDIREAVLLGGTILVMGRLPGAVLQVIPNPCACDPTFRGTSEFYRVASAVRDCLENAE